MIDFLEIKTKMSNTLTRLMIKGPDNDINHFMNAVKGNTNLDFYKILPMPFEIKYTIYPIKIITEEKYQQLWQKWMSKKILDKLNENEKRMPNIGMTIKRYNYLMEKYGSSNWCEWSIETYGTKINAYDVGEWKITHHQATIEYTTSWSPATEFYLNVSKLYPTLIFKHEFIDDHDVYIGNETIIEGQITDYEDLEENGEKAMLLKKSFNF